MAFLRASMGWFILAGLTLGSASANERLRPDHPASFIGVPRQKHYRLPNARVAWVDFARMRADFPPLRSISDQEIEAWIIREFAYISEMQLKLRGIRTDEFSVDLQDAREFVHPDEYYRAAVAEARLDGQRMGLVDLKGSGSSRRSRVDKQLEEFAAATDEAARDLVRIRDHSDGLASAGEIFSEVAKQNAVQATYDVLQKKGGETVENYFIILTGIRILKDKGASIGSAIVGRQPHFRGANFREGSEGIYTDDHGGFQRSVTGASVDFGGVIPSAPAVKDFFAIRPGGDAKNPQDSMAWAEGHRLADKFEVMADANIYAARAEVYAYIDRALGELREAWRRSRFRKPEPSEYEYWRMVLSACNTADVNEYFRLTSPGQKPEFMRALYDQLIHSKNLLSTVTHAVLAGVKDPKFFTFAFVEVGLPLVESGDLTLSSLLSADFVARTQLPETAEMTVRLLRLYLLLAGPPRLFEFMLQHKITRTDPVVIQFFETELQVPVELAEQAIHLATRLKVESPAIIARMQAFAADEIDFSRYYARRYLRVMAEESTGVHLELCRTAIREARYPDP